MTGKTVLLTGATGFIAKRIAFDLLAAGHRVRAGLRNPARADELRAALRPHLADTDALSRLDTVQLDLTEDAGWATAVAGVDAVLHTASPFPTTQPKDPAALIRPAVEGTQRVLRAARARGVRRVIVTSSVAAMMNADHPPGHVLTEADWTDPAHPAATTYDRSKTLAERAAWDLAEAHPDLQVTAINPGLVLGRPMDARFGSSLAVVQRFLAGRDPAVPDVGLPVVDVADVSAMHLAALARPETAGKRFIAAASWVTFPQLTREMAAAHPDRRIPTRTAPKALLRLMALFDGQVRTILPTVGRRLDISARRARDEMGIAFTPWQESLRATTAFLTAQEAGR